MHVGLDTVPYTDTAYRDPPYTYSTRDPPYTCRTRYSTGTVLTGTLLQQCVDVVCSNAALRVHGRILQSLVCIQY